MEIAVARARSRALYRDWMRAAHEIPILYAVNIPASAVRAKIRQDFERNLLVDDLGTVDILLLKGQQEYQVRRPPSYCPSHSHSRSVFVPSGNYELLQNGIVTSLPALLHPAPTDPSPQTHPPMVRKGRSAYSHFPFFSLAHRGSLPFPPTLQLPG